MDSIRLQGPDKIERSGWNIYDAAINMQKSVARLEMILENHQRFLADLYEKSVKLLQEKDKI